MGKAIKNFKDAISGVEEAKYRRLDSVNDASKPAEEKTAAKSANPEDKKTST